MRVINSPSIGCIFLNDETQFKWFKKHKTINLPFFWVEQARTRTHTLKEVGYFHTHGLDWINRCYRWRL